MRTKKSKKNIKRKTYKGGMPRKKPRTYAEGAAEEIEGSADPRILLTRDEKEKAEHLLRAIDTFFEELGIVQEFYVVDENAMIYLRFEDEDSYFYYTSFSLGENDLPDLPDLPNSVMATSQRFKDRLTQILQINNTHLYIKTTMCILNGLNFAYLIQAKIILTSLLHGIYISKKDDGTNAAEENSLRNFNFLLGFWFVDMTDGIQYPSDPNYDKKVEKRIEALIHTTPTQDRAEESFDSSSEDSDYSPSDSEESEEESFVDDLEGATVVTTDFEKWVFNIDTLTLVSRMLETVILPKSRIRWGEISKTNYLKHIQDKKTIGKGLQWSFINPSEAGVKITKIDSLNDYFTSLEEDEKHSNVGESRELEHGSSGGKKRKYKRKYTRKLKR
jgi:hypothetical protein